MNKMTKQEMREEIEALEYFNQELLDENNVIKNKYNQLLHKAAIAYAKASIVKLDNYGVSEKNSLTDYKFQVETMIISYVEFMIENSEEYRGMRLQYNRVYVSVGEGKELQQIKEIFCKNTHEETKYIECDALFQIEDKKIDIEVDGKNYHYGAESIDSAKEKILKNKNISVLRIKTLPKNTEKFLKDYGQKIMSLYKSLCQQGTATVVKI